MNEANEQEQTARLTPGSEREWVAVWGEHTVQAGRVDLGWKDGEPEDDDHVYLDHEGAAMLAKVRVEGPRTGFLRRVGRNALRVLED